MSKFTRFGVGLLPLLPGRQGANVVGSNQPTLVEQARAKPIQSEFAERIASAKAARFAIALDATGSMASLITNAKKSIGQIIRRVSKEAGVPIEIELFAYRDYDCPEEILARSGLSSDPSRLEQWLGGVRAHGGGGNKGEAIESALAAVRSAQDFRCVLVAGDEPSNAAGHLRSIGVQSPTARDLAKDLGDAGTPVHTFVIGDRASTKADFAILANSSGGRTGRLDGSREMIDMAVMAMLASLTGASGVERYMANNQLTKNSADFGARLLLPSA